MIRRFLTGLLSLLCCVEAANAGSVRVETTNEEAGHAWLFGSRNPASKSCWLAVPRHVVLSFDGETLLPFSFKIDGKTKGESGIPIAVTDVPGALEAAGHPDLAFAPVNVGPRAGECIDRLGLPSFAYDAALNRRDPLHVFNLLPSSFGSFEVNVEAGVLGGDRLRLGADAADTSKHFKKGLSGAVATLARPSGAEPFAMILSVEDGKALALRFDSVRAAFDLVETAALAAARENIAATTGIPFEITAFEGLNRGPGPAAAFTSPPGCWRVAPEGGKRSISLTINPDEGPLRGISIVQAASCGEAPLDVVIAQRTRGSSGWSVASHCTTVDAAGEEAACRLGLRSARELRITVMTTGETGISAVRVY